MQQTHAESFTDRVLLVLGFLSFIGAVVVAHSNPAIGYELSLYTATPMTFWVLYGCAMLVALVVALRTTDNWLRRSALGLGGAATAAFVGLPILRGYRFSSGGDAHTHLGWTLGIQLENFAVTELRYPGLHTVTTLVDVTFGIDTAHAMLLVIVVLAGAFFAFLTLSVSLVFESRYSTTVAAFSAFLLLPINAVGTHLQPHAMSQAILYSSVVLYLTLKYVQSRTSLRSTSAVGAALAISLITLVIYHPQLAAHLLAMFVGICAVQYLYRGWRDRHPIASHQPIYGQTLLLLAVFLVWTSNQGFYTDVIGFAITNVIDFVLGESGSIGGSAATESASVEAIGGSIVELFFKIFGPSLVFVILAGLLVLQTLRKSGRTLREETNGTIPYFIVSLLGLSGIFALYFFGSVSEMYFRAFGLMMLLVTIMGAVAVAYVMASVSRDRFAGLVHSVAVVGFGILLVVSVIAMLPSPYIYLSSTHVTDMSMSGHETAFEHQEEGINFDGIRAGPNRYGDIERAQLDRTRSHGAITAEEIDSGIAGTYSENRYLTVSRTDYEREVIAYKELRYSEAQLDSISTQPGVNRVQSNGEFELFYVRGAAD